MAFFQILMVHRAMGLDIMPKKTLYMYMLVKLLTCDNGLTHGLPGIDFIIVNHGKLKFSNYVHLPYRNKMFQYCHA